jgi:hypothetical protein
MDVAQLGEGRGYPKRICRNINPINPCALARGSVVRRNVNDCILNLMLTNVQLGSMPIKPYTR